MFGQWKHWIQIITSRLSSLGGSNDFACACVCVEFRFHSGFVLVSLVRTRLWSLPRFLATLLGAFFLSNRPTRCLFSNREGLGASRLLVRVNLEPRVLRLFGQRWVAGETEEPENSGLEIGYESVNYGIATIEPDSRKEHTEIHKIPMLGFNQASFDWGTAI